jgi:hypothetical protein
MVDMKMEELRIGNYFIGFDNMLTQWDLHCFKLVYEGIDIGEIVRDKIPLTEEWLLRFGFDKHPYSFGCELFHLTEWDKYPLNWCVAFNKNNAIIVHKLKYVHQLQNLYFALTNEELTLKQLKQ